MCVCKHCGSLRACAPRSNFCWRHPKIPEAVYNSNPWLPPSLISTALLSQRAQTLKVKPLSSTIAECAQSSLSCFTIRKSSCYTKRQTLLKPLTLFLQCFIAGSQVSSNRTAPNYHTTSASNSSVRKTSRVLCIQISRLLSTSRGNAAVERNKM